MRRDSYESCQPRELPSVAPARLLIIVVCGFPVAPSQAIEKLVALLDTLDRWIDETPPVDQPSRFGNKAYRTWYAKLDQVRLTVKPRLGWAGLGQWEDHYGPRRGKVCAQSRPPSFQA